MSTHSDIVRTKRHLNERADKLLRMLALEATGRVKKRTAVDTGRARNNWNVSVGRPDWNTTTATDKSVSADRFRHVLADAKFGDSIYITNGLPYIGKLEFGGYPAGPKITAGYPTQAPGGMVRVVAAELKPLAAQIAARIRSGIGG